MADNLSDYAENKILDHCLGKTSWTMPTSIKLGLFTSDPGEATGGTEVTGGSYARQTFTVDTAVAGATQNAAEIAFPVATADWGIIGWVVIYEAATESRIWHGALTATKEIKTDDQFKIATGALDITLG